MKLFPHDNQAGFTLVELIVAMSVFIVAFLVILDVFSTTLRVNRRSEGLVRASQSMRAFTESLVKEIRNSKIDYNHDYPVTGRALWTSGECNKTALDGSGNAAAVYDTQGSFRLGLVKRLTDGSFELSCYYLSDSSGNIKSTKVFPDANAKYITLERQINGGSVFKQLLNQPSDNFTVEYLYFYVFPTRTPYALARYDGGSESYAGIQPSVTIVARFKVKLPGMTDAEAIYIPYQTTVSSDVYDIPAIKS